jgi:DnaJ-domain-containing protein 1
MSGFEWMVVLGGLAIGYWVVSFFFGKQPPAAATVPPVSPASAPAPLHEAPPQAWDVVLGVTPFSSVADIRAAYRSLMSQYHPDKVASLGPELQALAERKTKEIGAAYREAMVLHGERE